MGTQIQSETCFLRHSSRNLSRSINTGRWLSYQERKVPENSQHGDSSSPWRCLMDRSPGQDKAKVKETILEHEVTFRHQVHELHRLYRRQKELTNAIQGNRLYKIQEKTEASKSLIFPSYMSSESFKTTLGKSHFLSSDSMLRLLDPSSSSSGQSHNTVLKRKNYESFALCGDMYLQKHAHMNKEQTVGGGRSFGLVGNGVGREDRTKEFLQERAPTSIFNNAVKYHSSAGASESNVRSKERNYLGYLNEPLQFLSRPSSVESSFHLSSNADNLERRGITANVSSGFSLHKQSSQYSMPVMNGNKFLSASPSDCHAGKELASSGFKLSNDLSLHVEHRTENRKKRKIFGVEIAEEVDDISLVSSDANNSYPRSNDTSPFLPKKAFTSHLSKMIGPLQGSHGAATSNPTWLKLGSCLQNLESIGGTDAPDDLTSSVMIGETDVMDFPTDPVSKKLPTLLVANPNDQEKSLSNYISGLRIIDLNLSIDEEEAPAAAALPAMIVKIIRPEIDLQVPALIESEVDHRGTISPDKSEEPHQYLINEAAKALVIISSTQTNDATSYANSLLENTFNCLNWFADVISSYTSDEDVIREISRGSDGCCDKEAPDGMDYFEFMTLQLKDVKEETYCYSVSDVEHQKEEETELSGSKRRPGSRGRQRKDFQKGILPDLVSLAKQEVVEDLQTLEELFHSTGKTWKSSLSKRNAAKYGRTGMKSGKFLHTTEAKSALIPLKQKQTGQELQLRGKSLTGWGKKTRRLPRRRTEGVRKNHVLPLNS